MSQVMLIAADKPLPLTGGTNGFRVEEHVYYRPAVDLLGYPMKRCQYELEFEEDKLELQCFRRYMKENCSSGESVELWRLWLTDGLGSRPVRYRGALAEFDRETLEQFLAEENICMTITI